MAARKPAASGIDAQATLEQYHDHLAPKLDVYEQAVYLHLLRHSRLVGKPRVTIELKTIPRMAAKTCRGKLESLDKKGCIELLEKRADRVVIRLFLPTEIPGVTGPTEALEEMDFYAVPRMC